jgi:hypothetical protein
MAFESDVSVIRRRLELLAMQLLSVNDILFPLIKLIATLIRYIQVQVKLGESMLTEILIVVTMESANFLEYDTV